MNTAPHHRASASADAILAGLQMGVSPPTSDIASTRLEGLDLARFVAFTGMVLVNFFMVMSEEEMVDSLAAWLIGSMSGRAAASFVVLAGIGYGLLARSRSGSDLAAITLKRAVFLFAIGLANSLIFDADILHYYAFYFLIGLIFVPLADKWLKVAIGSFVLGFLALALTFDFDAGWDWENYLYLDFWEPAGFTRNLLFNGWHPLVPWAAFFLFGMLLSRQPIGDPRFQLRLLLGGIGTLVAAESLSAFMTAWGDQTAEELSVLFETSPVPPLPLYMLAGMGAASIVVGACLLIAPHLRRLGALEIFARPGRQTLTLYIAHILVGMTIIEAMGLLGGQEGHTAMAAALLFAILAIFYAKAWSRIAGRGPVEWLMRKLTG